MKIENIKNICVVGAGNMGHQIAICAAMAGFNVVCIDLSQDMLNKAEKFTQKYLSERVEKGKLSQEAADEVKGNISFSNDLTKGAANADVVIEAIVEKLDIKRSLFAQLDKITPPHAILASNSSTIVSSKLADATKRPSQVCNMHFFNPALVMNLVEVVKGPNTSEDTIQLVMDLCAKLGKKGILVKKEIYGFVVNRLLNSMHEEAIFLVEAGIASPEDIDIAAVNALGHPMGPFQLMDLIGLDLLYQIAVEKFQGSLDSRDKPSPLLVEKFVKGEWGKKSGKGFYNYKP